jgi:haloacetate dehalogenase
VLVLWSRLGIGEMYDVLGIWKALAPHAHGSPIDCGHFLPEERPEETAAALLSFLLRPARGAGPC